MCGTLGALHRSFTNVQIQPCSKLINIITTGIRSLNRNHHVIQECSPFHCLCYPDQDECLEFYPSSVPAQTRIAIFSHIWQTGSRNEVCLCGYLTNSGQVGPSASFFKITYIFWDTLIQNIFF